MNKVNGNRAKSTRRKPHPSMPKWYWLGQDGCWFCKNPNGCSRCGTNKRACKADSKHLGSKRDKIQFVKIS